tara:strand:+ start:9458 stop:10270 length:813 start_codon:yes stop_codon:yes gene_type:complete
VIGDQQIWNRIRSRKLTLIAGPCVIESRSLCWTIARRLKKICADFDVNYVFKASYDKANRTSGKSYRGPGAEAGLDVLEGVRDYFEVPVTTDVHTGEQAIECGGRIDILQIPAFLCRQTDLIAAAVSTGKIVNVKKGQFLSPQEMGQVVAKAREMGGEKLLLTERGTTFGYNNLISDMRSIPIMKEFGCPVVFDATHSVQQPGGGGDRTVGQREFAPLLARCAVAAGAEAVFVETHPDPDDAMSDGPNMVPLNEMRALVKSLVKIKAAVA